MKHQQRTKKNNTPYVSHSAAGSEEEEYGDQYSCSSVGVFSATPTSTILLQEEEEINKGGLLGLVGAQKRQLSRTLPAESPRRFTNDIRGGGGGATTPPPAREEVDAAAVEAAMGDLGEVIPSFNKSFLKTKILELKWKGIAIGVLFGHGVAWDLNTVLPVFR